MKTKMNIIFPFAIAVAIFFYSCKKEKNNSTPSTPTTPPVAYTKGTLTNVTIMSIPNPSTFYEANGADIFWCFWANSDAGSPLIDGRLSPTINVQNTQFPLVYNYTTGYPVFLSTTANYFIKIYDEDVNTDGASSNKLIGSISFTWSELVANGSMIGSSYTGHVTKTVSGTSVQIMYTLEQ